MNCVIQYLRYHWQGKLTLGITFWVNCLLLGAIVHFAEQPLLRYFAEQPSAFFYATIAYAIVGRLLLLFWQIIGLLRAGEQHFKQHDNNLLLYAIQLLVIISLVFTTSHLLTSAQKLIAYQEKIDFENNRDDIQYTLEQPTLRRLKITGLMDFGLVSDTIESLNTQQSIDQVELESLGGQIYEGRGLAILFMQRDIATVVTTECSSACATAFIGGISRTMTAGAKIGFHRYGIDLERKRQVNAFQDLDEEQQKDIELFLQQGVDQHFIDQWLTIEHQDIWYPSQQELLEAGVITEL